MAYFQDLLSEYCASDLSMRLLEGEITSELDKFPPVVRKWILQFRRTEEEKSECEPIDGHISTEDFQEAFRAVKEKTSSLPSGINYTLWKCIASSNKISAYMAVMMRQSFMHGSVNDRWAKCINIMLEKKKGVQKIHMLRIIGLVEADFNTALKIF